MSDRVYKVKCPQCGSEVVRVAGVRRPEFPFCSERCKLLDLGKWLDEEHRIEEPLEPGSEGGSGAPDEK